MSLINSFCKLTLHALDVCLTSPFLREEIMKVIFRLVAIAALFISVSAQAQNTTAPRKPGKLDACAKRVGISAAAWRAYSVPAGPKADAMRACMASS
jgi:hypothetical protein